MSPSRSLGMRQPRTPGHVCHGESGVTVDTLLPSILHARARIGSRPCGWPWIDLYRPVRGEPSFGAPGAPPGFWGWRLAQTNFSKSPRSTVPDCTMGLQLKSGEGHRPRRMAEHRRASTRPGPPSEPAFPASRGTRKGPTPPAFTQATRTHRDSARDEPPKGTRGKTSRMIPRRQLDFPVETPRRRNGWWGVR